MKLVPKRRFAGFTDFWEQRRLGDLGDTFTGLSGKTKEDFGKGDAEFIPYLNVLNNPISDITFTEKVEVDKKQNEVMFGDIFFTTSSETAEEVGMSSVWLDDRKNVYLNSFCFGYRVRDNLDPFYMAYALRSFPVRKQLILLAQGISRYNISKRKAMDVRIHLPQLEEQKAIGSFFKKLDERIAMQEAKVEKLKAMKQAYLHEMFPAEGESVPKRRFAGFTNEWNKQRFGDVLRSHAFNEFLAKPVEYGSFEVIQQGDAPIVGYADGNPYKGFEDIVLFGDHTLSLYKPTRPFFLATDGVKILSGDNIDGSFLYTLIERYKPESQGYKRHFTILKDQICMLTSDREEQQKIGSFFKKLDERIAMQESKVEKLKAMKSAYLNEMFPAEGESVPKRRFAGFTDFWEQRRLGDLGDTFTGLSGKTKEDFGKGDAEFIPYLNVLNNPISDITFTEKVEVDKKQNEVMFGDIFFTTSSETAEEVGMSSVWLDDRKNVYLNSFCFGYRVRDNLDPFYMAYALRSFPVRKQLILLAQGISRYNISKRKAMDVRIHLPQLEEQKAIGSFFKKLDERIAMQEAKVEKLKAMKSAYLNEMFV